MNFILELLKGIALSALAELLQNLDIQFDPPKLSSWFHVPTGMIQVSLDLKRGFDWSYHQLKTIEI